MEAIKIGFTHHSNPWNRLSKGFYACICPFEIKNRVGICDLELVGWYPNRTIKDEKQIHRALYFHRICGEWFRLTALAPFPKYIPDINEATSIKPINEQYKKILKPITTTESNVGKIWSDEEVVELLQQVQKKIPLEEIANLHKRSYRGIYSRLQELAADYYYNDERPMEQIMKFTGLTEEGVKEAIQKRAMFQRKQPSNHNNYKTNNTYNTQAQILETLRDIKTLLLEINGKIKSP
jgi:hypothetical protein